MPKSLFAEPERHVLERLFENRVGDGVRALMHTVGSDPPLAFARPSPLQGPFDPTTCLANAARGHGVPHGIERTLRGAGRFLMGVYSSSSRIASATGNLPTSLPIDVYPGRR
jgi:hypothetical protein